MKKIILGIIIFILLIFLASGFFFLETSSGLHFLWRMASQYLPGELRVGELEGKLAGPLVIQNLSYRDSSFEFSVKQFELDWQLSDLFKRKWHIKKMIADDILLKWQTNKKPKTSQSFSIDDWNDQVQRWRRLFQFWNVQLDKIQVIHISGISDRKKVFQLDRAELKTYKNTEGFSIFSSKFITAHNVLEVEGKKKNDWTIDWRFQVPSLQQMIMSLRGAFTGRGHWHKTLTSQLEGRRIQWKDMHIRQFQNALSWNPALPKPFESQLQIDQVQWPSLPVHPVSLRINLALDFQYRDEKVWIDSDVSILKALLYSGSFNQTVTLPAEVEIVQKKKFKKASLKYEGKVHLKIGPKVHLEIMGMRGNLMGDLMILLNSKQLPTADGTVHIQKGTYDFYGQTLKIQKGELSFTHSRLTNPQLDIMAGRIVERPNEETAIRKTQKLMVGVKVQGTVEDPQPKLFSDPAGLQDADILSYLVLGKSMDEIAQDQTQLLLRAAQALNTGKGGGVTQTIEDIKHQFGLSELTIKTKPAAQGEASSNASLVVGKYLTRKLYVSYSVGLTGASNLLKIRYLLSPKWSVEVQNSSAGNGADLFYSIERD